MVEVVKRGNPKGEEVRETTCPRCLSELRFKRSEARHVSDQRDGNALVITCPVCNRENWIAA